MADVATVDGLLQAAPAAATTVAPMMDPGHACMAVRIPHARPFRANWSTCKLLGVAGRKVSVNALCLRLSTARLVAQPSAAGHVRACLHGTLLRSQACPATGGSESRCRPGTCFPIALNVVWIFCGTAGWCHPCCLRITSQNNYTSRSSCGLGSPGLARAQKGAGRLFADGALHIA